MPYKPDRVNRRNDPSAQRARASGPPKTERRGILAKGNGSDGVHYTGDGSAPTGVTVTAEQGNDTIEVPPAP